MCSQFCLWQQTLINDNEKDADEVISNDISESMWVSSDYKFQTSQYLNSKFQGFNTWERKLWTSLENTIYLFLTKEPDIVPEFRYNWITMLRVKVKGDMTIAPSQKNQDNALSTNVTRLKSFTTLNKLINPYGQHFSLISNSYPQGPQL